MFSGKREYDVHQLGYFMKIVRHLEWIIQNGGVDMKEKAEYYLCVFKGAYNHPLEDGPERYLSKEDVKTMIRLFEHEAKMRVPKDTTDDAKYQHLCAMCDIEDILENLRNLR